MWYWDHASNPLSHLVILLQLKMVVSTTIRALYLQASICIIIFNQTRKFRLFKSPLGLQTPNRSPSMGRTHDNYRKLMRKSNIYK